MLRNYIVIKVIIFVHLYYAKTSSVETNNYRHLRRLFSRPLRATIISFADFTLGFNADADPDPDLTF
jgi:hypothetical protein